VNQKQEHDSAETYTNVLWIRLGGRQIVHDLVGGEKAKRVGEVFKVLNDSEGAGEVVAIVACPWFVAIDTLAWQGRVDVEHHVDAGGVEDGGTLGVVEGGIKIVDAKCVHTQLLHEDCVSQADISISQGILTVGGSVCALASGLVVDTNNHQAVASNSIDEVAAANFNGIDSMTNIREDGGEEHSCASKLYRPMVSDTVTGGNLSVMLGKPGAYRRHNSE
jgi:hypothetical protein